jgi:hypothetical protein
LVAKDRAESVQGGVPDHSHLRRVGHGNGRLQLSEKSFDDQVVVGNRCFVIFFVLDRLLADF